MNIHRALRPLAKRYYCCIIISFAIPWSRDGISHHCNQQPYKALSSPVRERHISSSMASLFQQLEIRHSTFSSAYWYHCAETPRIQITSKLLQLSL